MSNKRNKQARKELERIYGKGCFFARAKIAERIETTDELSFKRFVEYKRYKGKKISHRITYHHLVHRADGGKATVENGANVEEIAHQYLHSLPRNKEEVINNMLREWKLNYVTINGDEAGTVDLENVEIAEDVIVIPVFEQKPKHKYNRAKTKREFQKRIEEDLEREDK